MKGILVLSNPEEQFHLDIDAWSRLMFERNSTKHGIPANTNARDAATRYPETFMCICAYYATRKAGILPDISYADFEMRWDGFRMEEINEDLTNPTTPAQ